VWNTGRVIFRRATWSGYLDSGRRIGSEEDVHLALGSGIRKEWCRGRNCGPSWNIGFGNARGAVFHSAQCFWSPV
jgi:hypothetical protein